jgi:hypothetical protein
MIRTHLGPSLNDPIRRHATAGRASLSHAYRTGTSSRRELIHDT